MSLEKKDVQHLADLLRDEAQKATDRKMDELKGFVLVKVREELNYLLHDELRKHIREVLAERLTVSVSVSETPNTPSCGG